MDSNSAQLGGRDLHGFDHRKKEIREVYVRRGGSKKQETQGFLPNQSTAFTNPVFDPDPGHPLPTPAMASANDGGDQGGSAEEPTRPKSAGRRLLMLEENKGHEVRYEVEEVSSSNWHGPALEGLGADEEDLIGGEVDMEDDAFV
jgi:hypothetical protein